MLLPGPGEKPLDRQEVLKLLENETDNRLALIGQELTDGYKLAQKYNDTVTVFGSARFNENNKHYQKAREVAGALAQQGFAIVTGGGPGIMEAANRGAFEVGCPSIGLGIELPHEAGMNQYLTDKHQFHYFFTRKVMLAFGADGYLFFPGGFGTFDELFEVVTLIQTGKVARVPIVMVGVEYWRGLDAYIQLQLLADDHTISPGDEQLYTITDDTDKVVQIMNSHREQTSALNKKEKG